MTRVLVIHGAGLNMRGKSQVELFGPATLDQINEQIRGYGDSLGVDVEIFHSNNEGDILDAIYDAHDRGRGRGPDQSRWLYHRHGPHPQRHRPSPLSLL